MLVKEERGGWPLPLKFTFLGNAILVERRDGQQKDNRRIYYVVVILDSEGT
jgi:hypothetical protein